MASAASSAGANCFCSAWRKLRRSELLSGCVFAGGCSFCHAFWYAAFLRRAPSPRARICALGAGSQLVRASPTGGSSLTSSAMRAFLGDAVAAQPRQPEMISIEMPERARFRRDFGALVGIQHTGDRRWAPRRLFEDPRQRRAITSTLRVFLTRKIKASATCGFTKAAPPAVRDGSVPHCPNTAWVLSWLERYVQFHHLRKVVVGSGLAPTGHGGSVADARVAQLVIAVFLFSFLLFFDTDDRPAARN